MGKIVKMSQELANMIAAGEVVERPSSVVKELVENSIDAKASTIKIFLRTAGLEEIKVIDDGEGMDQDDVCNAFKPHATSKIKNEYDLFRILTLGFRGEAIASIAAVSTMNITSSTDGVVGYSCTYKAGVMHESEIANHNKGTTVTVSGLFFNTPARLKYMKAPKSELASIMYFINRIAMAHLDLKFVVYNDDKLVFQTSGSDNYETLIGELYGLEAARNVIEHSFVCDGYSAHLVFVKPSIYRSNKLEITMVCNGRYVKNYNITNAVVDGFQTYLPISKFPIGIMYYEIDPLLIDVNVHPTKTEVKISNEDGVCRRLKQEIRKMLTDVSHIPSRELEINKNDKYQKATIFDNDMQSNNEEHYKPLDSDIRTVKESYVKQTPNMNLSFEEPKGSYEGLDFTAKAAKDRTPSYEEPDFNRDDSIDNSDSNNDNLSTMDIVKENTNIHIERKIPYMEYVGAIFGTYLIFQNQDGMYIMDQHAAHERINYERNYELLSRPNQPTTDLLIPLMLTFSKPEALYVENNLEEFKKIGFTLEPVGEYDFAVRGIPLWCKMDNLEETILELISHMIENHRIDIMYFRDWICKQISCKSSIKANHHISRLEVDALVSNLEKCRNPYTCPHGRPTIIKLTIAEIEKMFERIQK